MMIFMWIVSFLLLINTLYIIIGGGFNVGTLAMICMTLLSLTVSIWYKKLGVMCQSGFMMWVKYIVVIGLIFLLVMIIFIEVRGRFFDKATGNEKAIIVLGAGLKKDKPTPLLKHRLDTAFEYHKQYPEKIIVVTGGMGLGESIPEGEAMKKYLVDKGVPEDLILAETKSTSTEENFAFSESLLNEKGIDKTDEILFVTNIFHCYRTGIKANKTGYTNVKSQGAPIGVLSVGSCYLREVVAIVHTWIFG